MKALPLYDANAPIACTIDDADRPGRRDMIEQMRTASTAVTRTEHGLVLHFATDDRPLFDEFAGLEKDCCAFFGFGVDAESMRWDAPPDASGIMDRLYAFFADPSSGVDQLAGLL